MAWTLPGTAPAAAAASPAPLPPAAPVAAVPPPAPPAALPPQQTFAAPAGPGVLPGQQSFVPPSQSALPPVQQAAVPPPPVAAGAAPAIPEPPKRRSSRGKQLEAAAAPAPAAAPVAAPAPAPVPAPAVATQALVATPAPAGGALSLLPVGSYLHTLSTARVAPGASGIGRFAAKITGSGGAPNLFPTVYMTDAGLFDRDAMNVEGTDGNLPVGRDPFYAVYLGCRLKIVCWPKAAERNSANREAPRWQATISEDQPDWLEVAGAAISSYQFTSKDRRPQLFDALGHIKGSFEIAWFDPEAGIIVTRTMSLVNSMTATWANLQSAFPKQVGPDGLQHAITGPFPAQVAPGAPEVINSKGGQQWEEFPIQITQAAQDTGLGATWQSFEQWINSGGYTQEIDAALREWSKTTLTPEQCAVLQGVAAAKAQR